MRWTAFLVLLHFVHGGSLLDPFYILSPKGVETPSIENSVDYGKYVSKLIGVSVGTLGGCHLSGPGTISVVDLELYMSPIEKRQASTITGCTSSVTEADDANRKLSQTNAFEFNTFFEIKKCGKLAEPFGGTWDGELKFENDSGTIIEIKCSDGFTLEENIDPKVKCTDGHWSKLPNCTQMTCAELKPANADLTYSKPENTVFKERQEGSKATMKCQENYELQGNASATCKNGIWNPNILGSCEKKNDPNPDPPGPKQKSAKGQAFPIWAIILICVGAVGICCMFICCICRSKNQDDDDDGDVEFPDQRATRGSQTMPSMNLHINVDENDLGDEMFNSTQFNLAIQNMNDIEGMMNDFGDQVDENIEVIDGTEKILSTAGEARNAEILIEKFGEALDKEERSLEDVEKIMEEGTERVEEALSMIDGLGSVEKTRIVTIEEIEKVENDAATVENYNEFEKVDIEKVEKISVSTMNLSFREEELEEMMNMNQPKDFESFKKMASGKSDQSLKEAEDKTKGTISALLSDELKEINAMMNEEPLDFDSFKLTMSNSPFESSTGSEKLATKE